MSAGIAPRGGKFKGDVFTIPIAFGLGNTSGDQYAPPYGFYFGSTEADADATSDFPFIIRRLRVVITGNTASGSTVVSFRVNGATVASRTFLTTVVGESATGVLSLSVSAGDAINWMVNVTDGAAGTTQGAAYLICQRVIE